MLQIEKWSMSKTSGCEEYVDEGKRRFGGCLRRSSCLNQFELQEIE